MPVIALNREGLTATDVSVLTALSYKLSAEGIAGVCVQAVMDDGQRLVAILDPNNDPFFLALAKMSTATSSSTGMEGRWSKPAPASIGYWPCSNSETL